MPRARTRTVQQLPEKDYLALRNLTLCGFGGTGSMQPRFDTMRARANRGLDVVGYATTIRIDGQFVAWSLTFPFVNWRYRPEHYDWETYFFVHPDHRQEGYGTQLFKHVTRRFGKVCTNPWDNKSRQFFSKMGAS